MAGVPIALYVVGRFLQGLGICVVGVGLMIGLGYGTDQSFKAEVAYFVAGSLLFLVGLLFQRGKKS